MDQRTDSPEARPGVRDRRCGLCRLSLQVDLGGWQAVANPLHIPSTVKCGAT